MAEQAQSPASGADSKPQAVEEKIGITPDWAAGTQKVYLDQFVFVRLARARKGLGGPEDLTVRNSLLREELTVHVAFPLSRAHYLETWRKGERTSLDAKKV